MSSFHHPTGVFTIYDPGFPRQFPDTSTPVRSAMVIFEEKIRRDTFETGAFFAKDGHLLLSHTGDATHVAFSPQEIILMQNSFFTHNHPDGLTFSVEDIMVASEMGLAEVRAVTSLCRHMMEPRSVWPAQHTINSTYHAELAHAQKDVDTEVKSGQLSIQYATLELHHRAWIRTAAKLNLKYVREAS